MRPLPRPLFLVATALSLALATPGFADTPPAPQAPGLTIENHDKLATVKDENGAWLFAQVLPSANLKLAEVPLGKEQTRVSLSDASGKSLWSETLRVGVNDAFVGGEWAESFGTMLESVAKAIGAGDQSHIHLPDPTRLDCIIGPDDHLLSTQITFGKHIATIVPLKNGLSFKYKNKTVVVLLPPPAPQTAPPTVQASAQ